MNSILLSHSQSVLFSVCDNSELMLHSLHTLKPIQRFVNLEIGELCGIDLKRNLLVVGGEYKFCLLRLTKKYKNGNYSIQDILEPIYES